MSTTSYSITLQTIHVSTKKPLGNLRIEAWDKDILLDDFVGEATSNQKGEAVIRFTPKRFKELFGDRSPDLYFKVYRGDKLLADTEGQVMWNVDLKSSTMIIPVNDDCEVPAGAEEKTFSVKGAVSLSGGKPAAGVWVKAFHQLLTGEALLGESATDFNGAYRITYVPVPKGTRLFVRVYESEKASEFLNESEVVFRPADHAIIDVRLAKIKNAGLSLYAAIENGLRAELGKLTIDKITDKQLPVLADASGIERKLLIDYRRSKITALAYPSLPATFFFSLARNRNLTDDSSWQKNTLATISHALQEAQQRFYVPILSEQEIQTQLNAYQALRARYYMDQPLLVGNGKLTDLVGLITGSTTVQSRVGAVYADHSHDAETLWSSLAIDKEVLPHIPQLQKLFSLHKLTIGNIPLVEKLRSNKAVKSITDLAAWNTAMWKTHLNDADVQAAIPEGIPGGSLDERVETYALFLTRVLTFLFPTTAISASLQQDTTLSADDKKDFSVFFSANPNFKIETHSAGQFLSANPDALRGIADKEGFTRQLFDLNRQFALAPISNRYEGMRVMRKMNITSAFQATGQGWSSFNTAYTINGGTSAEAAAIFDNALTVVSYVNNFNLLYNQDLAVLPYVIPTDLKQDPLWQELFGKENLCACHHCRSIYSPAAYLADLLHFLEKRKLDGAGSALDVLNARRPDIQHILLNCTNAHTAMPYIDLVNEILECAVTNTPDFKYDTTRESAELKVLPEKINTEAYNILASMKYPWSLPFDLFTETGRLFLAHLGTPHDELIRLILPASDVNNETRACAILGILPEERKILVAGDSDYQENAWWGLSAGAAFNEGESGIPVNVVLTLSGLSFAELQELLRTRFINRENSITIDDQEECTLDGAVLLNFNRTARRNFLQFVRLRNKAEITTRELDHFLVATGGDSITARDLINLSVLKMIRQRFHLPADEISSWWGILPTAHRADDEDVQMLYENTFLSNTLQREFIPTSQGGSPAFTLNAGRDKLNHSVNPSDPAIFSYLLAALNTDPETLRYALMHIGDSVIGLVGLSRLYRILSLAKCMRITVQDLFLLKQLSGIDPFQPENTLRFIDCHRLFLRIGYTVGELGYLFLHKDAANYSWSTEEEDAALQELRSVLSATTDQKEREVILRNKLAAVFGTSPDLMEHLLNPDAPYLHVQEGQVATALDGIYTRDTFVAGTITEVHREGLILLQKVLFVLKRLKLSKENYGRLISTGGKSHFINFDLFPVRETASAANLFGAFEDVLAVSLYAKEVVTDELNIWSAFQSDEFVNLFESDSAEQEVMKRILNANTGETLAKQYALITGLKRVKEKLGLKLGDWMLSQSSPVCILTAPVFSEATAQRIITLVRSKYSHADWLKKAPALRDLLRDKQRDALVSCLLGMNRANGIEIEDLYAHFLIDVEMAPCMTSSRIRLALSSVQLFVQRCLLHLEPQVKFDMSDENEKAEWEEWSWRKNYRVWEANRKIFLYPENWLEPEWRDDKTPFFMELEDELQQKKLNGESAESAYLNYLEKLRQVSNMQVIAMCPGEIAGSVYLFARSNGQPRELYFVLYDKSTEHFSAWQKIEVDIEGDHLVPVLHLGRLLLFWPVFKEKTEEKTQTDTDAETALPGSGPKYWEISLNWVEYHNGAWKAKKTSDAILKTLLVKGIFELFDLTTITSTPYKGEKTDYYFRPESGSSDLKIHVYQRDNSDNVLRYEEVERIPRRMNIDPDSKKEGADPIIMPEERVDPDSVNDPEDKLHNHIGFFRFEYPSMSSASISPEEVLEDHLVLNGIEPKEVKGQRWVREGFLKIGGTTLFATDDGSAEDAAPFEIVAMLRKNAFTLNDTLPVTIRKRKHSYLVWRLGSEAKYSFRPLYHPFVSKITIGLMKDGFKDFFHPSNSIQEITDETFVDLNPDMNYVVQGAPIETISFERNDLFAQYNWELFFHIPALIAVRMNQNGSHEEAMNWFHYIFNPTLISNGSPQNCWILKEFRNYDDALSIRELLEIPEEAETSDAFYRFEHTILDWERNPFNPHAVARVRHVAYMKWIVMKYIDNLLEWADQLFRQDTTESLNEATQLYLLAWNILGKKDEQLSGQKTDDLSYNDIRGNLDSFSNSWVQVVEEIVSTAINRAEENTTRFNYTSNLSLPAREGIDLNINTRPEVDIEINRNAEQPEVFSPHMLYFCIPPNEKFVAYWSFLSDRFYKLRNCLNIEGVFRQLPLYEPPIDPSLLINARAAGLSMEEIMQNQGAVKRNYRFYFLLQRAAEYASEVRNLGSALLQAIEKRDGEQIMQLRAAHEINILKSIRHVKNNQLKEAAEQLDALAYSLSMADKRKEYYSSRQFMNAGETAQMVLMAVVNRMQMISQSMNALAAAEKTTPTVTVGGAGTLGTPVAITTTGGGPIGEATETGADAFSKLASVLNLSASEIGQMASYQRRFDDWTHQADLATDEVEQVNKHILAARIRLAIAQRELDTHDLQIEQSTAEQDLIQSKFSNRDLYHWMTGQLKSLYYQSYQMAFEMARRAEEALRFELPSFKDNGNFIRPGYWNSLQEGLLCGEKLHQDIKRMEVAYIDNNKRLHEVTKTVSLAMVSADALVGLKNIGTCSFSIPKTLFDLDFPQHAGKLRRIKAVSLSVPCVTGPYTGVNCILSATADGTSSSIATSTGLNDTGIFQFSFSDERYLPFEGMPVDCNWTIDMNAGLHAFDFGSISDVLLHIHYTADPDFNTPAETTEGNTSAADNRSLTLTRYISLRNEFVDEWTRFKNNPQPTLEISLTEKLFPYMFRQEALNTIGPVAAWTKNGDTYTELATIDVNFASPKVIVNGTTLSSVDDVLLAVKYTVVVN